MRVARGAGRKMPQRLQLPEARSNSARWAMGLGSSALRPRQQQAPRRKFRLAQTSAHDAALPIPQMVNVLNLAWLIRDPTCIFDEPRLAFGACGLIATA